MQENFEEQSHQEFQKEMPKISFVDKVKGYAHEHPTLMIVGGFALLPIIVVAVFALVFKMKDRSLQASNDLTPTPTSFLTSTPAFSPTPFEEDDVTPTKSPTPTKKVSVTPTKSLTTSPTVTVTPSALANIYFHSVKCTAPEASGSATVKDLDGLTYASASAMPSSATCEVIFQNSEDVETGEIYYRITMDDTEVKKANVGKLKKGNYPTGEYKGFTESVGLRTSTGDHKLKIELNPDKNFSEANYNDNTYTATYKVQ